MLHCRGSIRPVLVVSVALSLLCALGFMLFSSGSTAIEAQEEASAAEREPVDLQTPEVANDQSASERAEQASEASPEEAAADADAANALPVDATGITGRIIGRDGKPAAEVEVVIERSIGKKQLAKYSLTLDAGKDTARFTKTTKTGPDGRFAVPELIADSGYTLRARGEKGLLGRKDGFEVVDKLMYEIGDVALRRGAIVTGIVRAEGGAPIEGAEINFNWNWNERPYKTDARGKFTTDVLMPGKQQIRVKAKGYALRETLQREFVEGDVVEDLEIELVKAELIRGRVVDDAGRGVKEAEVNAYRQQEEMSFFGWMGDNTKADANGDFMFDSLPGGNYQVGASRTGYREAQQEGVKAGGDPVELKLKRMTSIEGTIVDAKTGAGIKADRLRLLFVPPNNKGNQTFRPYYRNSESDLDEPGKFSVTLDEGGYFKVEITADGYQPGESSPFQLAENTPMSGIVVRLEKGQEIEVLATDKATKAPVAGAIVRVMEFREPSAGGGGNAVNASMVMSFNGEMSFEGGGPRTRGQIGRGVTGVDGIANVKSLYPGKFMALAKRVGFADAKLDSFEVKQGDSLVHVEVQFTLGGGIEGRVTNDRNLAEPALTVIATSTDNQRKEAVTDDQGHYLIPNLTPGRYKVTGKVENDDGQSWMYDRGMDFSNGGQEKPIEERFPVVVEEGKDSKNDFAITRIAPGSIAGSVLFNGVPAAGVMVMAMKGSENGNDYDWNYENQTKTDAQGHFKFRTLKPGKYGVSAGKSWERSYSAGVVTVVSAQEASVVLEVALGSIRGRVVDQNGTPVAGANLSVNAKQSEETFNPWGNGRSTQSDANGDFLLEDLQAGDYSFYVQLQKYKPFHMETVTVQARREAGPIEVKLEFGGWIELSLNGVERLGANPRLRATVVGEQGNTVMNTGLWPDAQGKYWIDCNNAPKGTLKLFVRRQGQPNQEIASAPFELQQGQNLVLPVNIP